MIQIKDLKNKKDHILFTYESRRKEYISNWFYSEYHILSCALFCNLCVATIIMIRFGIFFIFMFSNIYQLFNLCIFSTSFFVALSSIFQSILMTTVLTSVLLTEIAGKIRMILPYAIGRKELLLRGPDSIEILVIGGFLNQNQFCHRSQLPQNIMWQFSR